MQGTSISRQFLKRKSIDYRLLYRYPNLGVDGHSAKPLYHSNVSPSPDRSGDSTPTGGLSLCALSEGHLKNLAHSHHLSMSREKQSPYDQTLTRTATIPCPKAIDAPHRTRAERTHPCTALRRILRGGSTNQTIPSHSEV